MGMPCPSLVSSGPSPDSASMSTAVGSASTLARNRSMLLASAGPGRRNHRSAAGAAQRTPARPLSRPLAAAVVCSTSRPPASAPPALIVYGPAAPLVSRYHDVPGTVSVVTTVPPAVSLISACRPLREVGGVIALTRAAAPPLAAGSGHTATAELTGAGSARALAARASGRGMLAAP